MTNFEIALAQLDGLIAGLEMGSEIPVQLCELTMLRFLLGGQDDTPQPACRKCGGSVTHG